jgi:hypothetical protein
VIDIAFPALEAFGVVWHGTEALSEHLAAHRRYVEGSVPVYARLLELLEARIEGPLGGQLDEVWGGRSFCAAYERPLLLLAALRFAALSRGPDHGLHAALVQASDPGCLNSRGLDRALQDALTWTALRDRQVQTNETSRAVVWLWLAVRLAQRQPDMTFALFDIGASAGLNLVGDQLPWIWSDQAGGSLLSSVPELCIVERRGFDRNPIDATDPDDARWLLACVWPGQSHRIERLAAALAAYQKLAQMDESTPGKPRVERASLGSVPALLKSDAGCSIAYQSIVRDYVEAAEFALYNQGIRRWLCASPGKAVWAELELSDGDNPPERSVALRVHCAAPGEAEPRSFELLRCHPHPTRLHVDPEQLAALERCLR